MELCNVECSNEADVTFDFTSILSSPKNGFTPYLQGSEAKLYVGTFLNQRPALLKERFVKKYRHLDLDKSLTYERMRQEVRTLVRCKEIGIFCPTIYFVDFHERFILMEYIQDSITVKEFIFYVKNNNLDQNKNLEYLGKKIGLNLAIIHKNDIIHGDLTTSNMLIPKIKKDSVLFGKDFDLYFIDFGLSKKTALVEDKAVDLYVLERAILSSHPEVEYFFEIILKTYFENVGKASKSIMTKLKDVQQRGRKRSMVG